MAARVCNQRSAATRAAHSPAQSRIDRGVHRVTCTRNLAHKQAKLAPGKLGRVALCVSPAPTPPPAHDDSFVIQVADARTVRARRKHYFACPPDSRILPTAVVFLKTKRKWSRVSVYRDSGELLFAKIHGIIRGAKSA